jgi:hypothetical protein
VELGNSMEVMAKIYRYHCWHSSTAVRSRCVIGCVL